MKPLPWLRYIIWRQLHRGEVEALDYADRFEFFKHQKALGGEYRQGWRDELVHSSTKEHVGIAVPVGGIKYQPKCWCGWEGQVAGDVHARIEAQFHESIDNGWNPSVLP